MNNKNVISKSKKVCSNLLQQNVYVRDCTLKSDLQSAGSSQSSYYTSLDEEITEDGNRFKYVDYEYPITPSYVNSFASGSDYHNDLQSALLSSPPGKNLNDVSSLQKILSMPRDEQSALYQQLKSIFSKKPVESSAFVSSSNVDKTD